MHRLGFRVLCLFAERPGEPEHPEYPVDRAAHKSKGASVTLAFDQVKRSMEVESQFL